LTATKYKFGKERVLSIWLLPVIITLITIFSFYTKIESQRNISVTDLLAWIIFSLFAVGIFIILFFNHLRLARHTELEITQKSFAIIQYSKSYSFELSEITEIIEYSTGRLPWSSIAKWSLKVGEREFIISSLTISKPNFDRHFYNKKKQIDSFFPTV
jgi:hypothetical protein